MAAGRRLTVADIVGIVFATLGLGALWLYAIEVGPFERMYRDLGPSARLPWLTELAFGHVFRIALPSVLMLATAAAILFRPRFVLLALGLVSVAAGALMWIAMYQPIWALAGNIRAD